MDMFELTRIVNALGWTLIHSLWQLALVAAVFAALRAAAGPHALLRYWLGLGALASALAVTAFTFMDQLAVGALSGIATGGVLVDTQAVAMQVVAEAGVDWTALINTWAPWLVSAWAAGVLLHASRLAIGWIGLRRLILSTGEACDQWQARADRIAETLGIRRSVRVLRSVAVHVPCVIGWLKPVVLLPTSTLVGLTPMQIELIIAHELGHVRRGDYLANLFQLFVETLLFHHPAVRWISREVRVAREQCCDDLVVARFGEPVEYARALATLEELRSVAPAVGASDGELVGRVRRLLLPARSSTDPAWSGQVVLIALFSGAVLMAASQWRYWSSSVDHDGMTAPEASAEPGLLASIGAGAREAVNGLAQWSAELVQRGAERPVATSAPIVTPVVENAEAAPASLDSAPLLTDLSVATDIETSASSAREDVVVAAPSATATRIESPVTTPVRETEQVAVVASGDALASVPSASLDVNESVPDISTGVTATRVASPSVDIAANSEPVEARESNGVPLPQLIEAQAPQYPRKARLAGVEGQVTVAFRVSETGAVIDPVVVQAEPARMFEREALRALRDWRYESGSAAAASGQLITRVFEFRLEGSRDANGGDDCVRRTGTRLCQ